MSAEHEGPPDFSELSALMKQFHQGSFKAARDWSEALRQLVERARQHDEERFDEVWAPHLKQYFSQDHPALPMNFETEQEDEIFDRIREFVVREYPDTVYLNVSSCDEGVESLARCARLCPGARVVYAQDWGDFEGGEELFDSPHASLIVSLLLAEVFLEGSDEMEPLVYGLRKSALRFLSLEECSLGAECLDALAQIEALHTLQGLALRDNRITQEGLSFLLASPHLANVTRLDMGGRYLGNELGDEGAVMLCHAPELAGLTYLDLGSNSIGSRGLRALTESDVLSGLEYLNLSRNKFSREDWACLHSATFNASMRYLVLPYCFEDEESMAEFERMYRSCSSAQVVWFE